VGILAGMARKVRVEFAGAIYHVINRGDRQEAIFRDEQDRQRFLATLAETCLTPRLVPLLAPSAKAISYQ